LALDRQSIEKRDFPIGRRGYDPEAVDSHLAALADEVDTLRRSAGRQRGDTLAVAASEQVRMIVEAAEQSAADIEREAELEARRIRQDSREQAEKVRTEAATQAREHVQRVSESCGVMLERIDAMESELRGLLESLRSGANRVSADLALLQGSVGDLRSAGAPAGTIGFEAEDRPGSAAALGASAEPALAADDEIDDEPAPVAPAPAPAASRGGNGGGDSGRAADEEGARLIALNMALNGTPRDETEQYLSANFELDDPQALLDDVYARAGQ
jgi:vacuolar-type H+-ATPase subunit H